MLVELVVENYAVIERVRVRFHAGLNLLTGETGSGKSLVVDALGLLFGGRASAEIVRAGADRARISGVFEVGTTEEFARTTEPGATGGSETVPGSPGRAGPVRASEALAKLLDRTGIELEDGELLVEREIQSNGKSRALVGSRPVTAALLRELAPLLGDIHGQHDQQRLFESGVQCEMLDDFAGAEELAHTVSAGYRKWREATAELEELNKSSQEKLRLSDLWNFQRREIEAAALKSGEDAELENERRVLRNVVRLQESAGAAYAALYEDPHSALAQLRVAAKRVEEVAKIDDKIQEIASALRHSAIAADEAAHGLRSYLGSIEADPARLDDVEARLAVIEKLKRKYGPTIEQIAEFLAEAVAGLAAVESSSDRRQALESEVARLAKAYEAAAQKLSAVRREAAKKLGPLVQHELSALAMEKARVEIRVELRLEQAAWSETGMDTVAFLIAPNPGEEPKPLDKIASGGELSRVALALKSCVGSKPTRGQGKAAPLTLVFDEVDAGVGGGAAEAVGRRLKGLSRSAQVICVTHLPQIAGFADHHYSVEKHTVKGRTVAAVEELTAEARTREIGRMLSGETVTREALQHAQKLMKFAAEQD